MTDSNLLELAKLGDPQAIESLMNQSLQSRGMSASVTRQGSVLEVVLEAERVPNRQALTAFVQKGIHNLGIQSIQSIRILGQQIGVGYPAWMQELQLDGLEQATDQVINDQATSAAADLSSSLATPLNIQPETAPETETSDLSGSNDRATSAKDTPTKDISATDVAGSTNSGKAEFEPEPAASLPEPDSDQGLLDFLNDLSPGAAREDFPAEAVQEQSIFADSSTTSRPMDESIWIDSTAPSEQPDDLLSFLNQSDLDEFGTAEESPLASEDAVTAASIDQLPDLFGDESFEAEPLTEPSDEFLSTLLSDSSDPIPAADMPPPSAVDHPADTLDSQLDDLFALEPETELSYSEETEELLPEHPPEDNTDLLQALINEAHESGSEASTGEVGSDALTDPWIEGTEDPVLGLPDDAVDPADIEHSAATPALSENLFQSPTVETNQPAASPPIADSSLDPAPDNPDSPAMNPIGNKQFNSLSPLVDEDEFGTVEEIPPDFLLELQDEPADFSAAEPDRSESFFPSQPSSDPATGLEADEWQTAPQSSLESDLAALDLTDDLGTDTVPAGDTSAKPSRPEQPSDSPSFHADNPDLSQDALEAGLGDFREGFVEPLPSELLEDDNQLDWQADLREPLSLDDEEGNYIIEDSPPDYTPPEYTPPEYTSPAAALPDAPETPAPPAPEHQNPPWLFTAVLLGLCSLIAGLLGFSLFWSKLAPPPNSPPSTEPAPSSTPAPASPNSAKPAPANSARLATAQLDRG